jgi:hypothetical protein
MGRSCSVGFLKDHIQASVRAEAQLHQLTSAAATMQISLKDMQDEQATGPVKVSTVSRYTLRYWRLRQRKLLLLLGRRQPAPPRPGASPQHRGHDTLVRSGAFRDVRNGISFRHQE